MDNAQTSNADSRRQRKLGVDLNDSPNKHPKENAFYLSLKTSHKAKAGCAGSLIHPDT